MRSYIIFLTLITSLMSVSAFAQVTDVLRPLEVPATLAHLISQVVLDPHDKDRIVFHTGKHVYDSRDFAATWNVMFETRGIDEEVITVMIPDHDQEKFFIITTRKIYSMNADGAYAHVIFERRGTQPLTFAVDPFDSDRYLLGASDGCYISDNGGDSWDPVYGLPADTRALYVTFHPNFPSTAFVVTSQGLYKVDTERSVARKVMTLVRDSSDNDVQEIDNVNDSSVHTNRSHISFSLNDDRRMFFVFNSTLFRSNDGGERWDELPLPSAVHTLSSDVRLLSDQDSLLFSSKDALWRYDENAQPLFKRISALPRSRTHSFDLYEGRMDTIVVGADRALYYSEIGRYVGTGRDLSLQSNTLPLYNEVLSRGRDEALIIEDDLPHVRELQEAAIAYGLLSTRRMKSWEWRSRLKSFIPRFSFDIEFDSSNNIDIDRGSTSEADVFLDGPDEEDVAYGISVDWDLSELIWNDTETSIEIRERALVDQRDEILREVTRLYFEYKRLQRERALFMEFDPRLEIANELRIEEIRAQLDALTGGYVTSFSQH
ncbi:MAG: hypothetical protein JW938_02800 [Candidatus Omnitrophica bacterium]|nr:hypothetical protein [Candidatus Omnitrophota bacterium]